MFELLSFGHLAKIAIGFGISWSEGAEGNRCGGKILEQMVMATWPWNIPAVRTLDSTSDEEMAGAAVSTSKNQNQISSNHSKEELTRILDLIWMKSLPGGTHPCWIHHLCGMGSRCRCGLSQNISHKFYNMTNEEEERRINSWPDMGPHFTAGNMVQTSCSSSLTKSVHGHIFGTPVINSFYS